MVVLPFAGGSRLAATAAACFAPSEDSGMRGVVSRVLASVVLLSGLFTCAPEAESQPQSEHHEHDDSPSRHHDDDEAAVCCASLVCALPQGDAELRREMSRLDAARGGMACGVLLSEWLAGPGGDAGFAPERGPPPSPQRGLLLAPHGPRAPPGHLSA